MTITVRALFAAALCVIASSATAQMAGPMGAMRMPPMPTVYGGQADKPGAPVFRGLGDHHHAISTHNKATQALFDQGVQLLFGFNHAEAIRSFREAARLDPACAMCWWGVAFALGPNINLPMPADAVPPAWQALAKAQALEGGGTPEERAWIAALATRYSPDPTADRKPLDEAFAAAMGRVWRNYPTDLDAGVFWAEAMMDTQPWDYWQADGATPKGHGAEIVAALERVIAAEPRHPGALHLYIHAVEGSTTPERAEAAADRLATLMPGAGHIVHMPSHIYYRVGRYRDAIEANRRAAKVDESYIAACKAQGYYPIGYYGHNIHFLWSTSQMMGRYGDALGAARRLVKAVNAVETAKTLPYAELYALTPVATLLRFGRWREILAEPAPPASLKIDSALWLQARGFALANTGDLDSAREVRTLLALLAGEDLAAYDAAGLPARQMVALSLALLDGEIARKGGKLGDSVAHFKQAAEIERNLPYTEPPYAYQPVSHVLGEALIEDGRAPEAEAVYRASLQVYRRDGWSLMGLSQALAAQHKTKEAARARGDFRAAWVNADVTLGASRF